MKNILIVNANPKADSLCKHLADMYEIEAREYHRVRRFNLSHMAFDANLSEGYAPQTLEPCLEDFQQALIWAEHLVIVSPVWWGGLPAAFKGLLDRSLLPGFAFRYDANTAAVIPLLQGKTARLMFTMDAPADFAEQQAEPVVAQLDRFTLQFCGFAPANISYFPAASWVTAELLELWQQTIKAFGRKGE
ncbi:NAD(P)H-dependent oxidoreductase [Shewanella litorisediminis]|uniref:NAD(P)H-dependent oxidoreductase n=1 Tax=Shewanella litorisediminis TaxID=1173586 RepID=A0ABX7G140_9GAMM|nr:NAD(P)H-dependent oxidoreductase [Shewanella litorisediminis]MCL2918925.1 NAD(P)H-dependent oxidoreductase [Shewanella litorisediminis]QRH00996.1 NAD(P)H-dependent oxidoreductase [Shewanella litorisediminis]